jgi:prepilin-type N-terminal cleavage/methylation domain-containing protein
MKTISRFASGRSKGFTLIELLVVIAIIGILSSVVLASLNSARKKGRDSRRIADVQQIMVALELAYDDLGEYPDALSDLDPTYIASVPTDPQTAAAYSFDNLTSASAACAVATGVCSTYIVGATLEDTGHNSLDADVDGTVASVACADPVYCRAP